MNTISKFRALAASALLAGSLAGHAATPADAELDACLARVGQAQLVRDQDISVIGADSFGLGSGRRMIAVDARIGSAGFMLRPRLYCTLEADGSVSLLQSMPRMDLRPAAEQIVVK